MHEVLVNRLGGLSLPRKSVVRLTDRPDMTLDVYRGRKTTIQQQHLKLRNLKVNYAGSRNFETSSLRYPKLKCKTKIVNVFKKFSLIKRGTSRYTYSRYRIVVVVVLLFFVHGKHLTSCRDGQLT